MATPRARSPESSGRSEIDRVVMADDRAHRRAGERARCKADPAEGEALSETGTDLVDVVAMPDAVRAEVEDFIARHHVERPFYKRKRDRADPESLARQKPLPKEPG